MVGDAVPGRVGWLATHVDPLPVWTRHDRRHSVSLTAWWGGTPRGSRAGRGRPARGWGCRRTTGHRPAAAPGRKQGAGAVLRLRGAGQGDPGGGVGGGGQPRAVEPDIAAGGPVPTPQVGQPEL